MENRHEKTEAIAWLSTNVVSAENKREKNGNTEKKSTKC